MDSQEDLSPGKPNPNQPPSASQPPPDQQPPPHHSPVPSTSYPPHLSQPNAPQPTPHTPAPSKPNQEQYTFSSLLPATPSQPPSQSPQAVQSASTANPIHRRPFRPPTHPLQCFPRAPTTTAQPIAPAPYLYPHYPSPSPHPELNPYQLQPAQNPLSLHPEPRYAQGKAPLFSPSGLYSTSPLPVPNMPQSTYRPFSVLPSSQQQQVNPEAPTPFYGSLAGAGVDSPATNQTLFAPPAPPTTPGNTSASPGTRPGQEPGGNAQTYLTQQLHFQQMQAVQPQPQHVQQANLQQMQVPQAQSQHAQQTQLQQMQAVQAQPQHVQQAHVQQTQLQQMQAAQAQPQHVQQAYLEQTHVQQMLAAQAQPQHVQQTPIQQMQGVQANLQHLEQTHLQQMQGVQALPQHAQQTQLQQTQAVHSQPRYPQQQRVWQIQGDQVPPQYLQQQQLQQTQGAQQQQTQLHHAEGKTFQFAQQGQLSLPMQPEMQWEQGVPIASTLQSPAQLLQTPEGQPTVPRFSRWRGSGRNSRGRTRTQRASSSNRRDEFVRISPRPSFSPSAHTHPQQAMQQQPISSPTPLQQQPLATHPHQAMQQQPLSLPTPLQQQALAQHPPIHPAIAQQQPIQGQYPTQSSFQVQPALEQQQQTWLIPPGNVQGQQVPHQVPQQAQPFLHPQPFPPPSLQQYLYTQPPQGSQMQSQFQGQQGVYATGPQSLQWTFEGTTPETSGWVDEYFVSRGPEIENFVTDSQQQSIGTPPEVKMVGDEEGNMQKKSDGEEGGIRREEEMGAESIGRAEGNENNFRQEQGPSAQETGSVSNLPQNDEFASVIDPRSIRSAPKAVSGANVQQQGACGNFRDPRIMTTAQEAVSGSSVPQKGERASVRDPRIRPTAQEAGSGSIVPQQSERDTVRDPIVVPIAQEAGSGSIVQEESEIGLFRDSSSRNEPNVKQGGYAMPTFHPSSQPSSPGDPGTDRNAENQERRQLRIENVLAYLEKVKTQFSGQLKEYNEVLDIMNQFEAQSIDTIQVIRRISFLFRGKKELLLGFNVFLPPGFQILVTESMDIERFNIGFIGPNGYTFLSSSRNLVHDGKSGSSKEMENSGEQDEYEKAMSFVKTASERFVDKPEKYQAFLFALDRFQKDKERFQEVFDSVAALFAGHEDLLRQFKKFLPAIAFQSLGEPHAGNMPTKLFNQSQPGASNTSTLTQKEPDVQSEQPLKKAQAIKFFDTLKETLGPSKHGIYLEFMKCFQLFTEKVLEKKEFESLVSGIFENCPEAKYIFLQFFGSVFGSSEKTMEKAKERTSTLPLAIASASRNSPNPESEVDNEAYLTSCGSYRLLPKDSSPLVFSGRSILEKKVLNDEWVSETLVTEEYSGKFMRTNSFEGYVFRCEDERYELDMLIETNVATIHRLEKILCEISLLSSSEKAMHALVPGVLSDINISAIQIIYGESHGPEVVALINLNPVRTVPVVVKRLRKMNTHWRQARIEMNIHWRALLEKKFHKSLDHRSTQFKSADNMELNSDTLISDIMEPKVSMVARYEKMNKSRGYALPTGGGVTNDRSGAIRAVQQAARNFSTNSTRSLELMFENLQIHPLVFDLLKRKILKATSPREKGVRLVDEFKNFVEKFFDIDLSKNSGCVRTNRRSSNIDNNTVLYGDKGIYLMLRYYHIVFERIMFGLTLAREKVADSNRRNDMNLKGGLEFQAEGHIPQLTTGPSEISLPFSKVLDEDRDFSIGPQNETAEEIFEEFLGLLRNISFKKLDSKKFEEKCQWLLGSGSYCLFNIDKAVQKAAKAVVEVFERGEKFISYGMVDLFYKSFEKNEESKQQGGSSAGNYQDKLYLAAAKAHILKTRGPGANVIRLYCEQHPKLIGQNKFVICVVGETG